MLDLRPYRQPADSAAVYALWQAALGQQWPIAAADFHQLLTGSPQYQAGDYFVACQAAQIVGFVAAQIDRSQPASARRCTRRPWSMFRPAVPLRFNWAVGIAISGRACRLTYPQHGRFSKRRAGSLMSHATTWRRACRSIAHRKIRPLML